MTSAPSSTVQATTTKPGETLSMPTGTARYVFVAILLVAACQFWLIFEKAINWDEFLHFGHIYKLADGRLTSSLQTLPTRFFGWTTLPQTTSLRKFS